MNRFTLRSPYQSQFSLLSALLFTGLLGCSEVSPEPLLLGDALVEGECTYWLEETSSICEGETRRMESPNAVHKAVDTEIDYPCNPPASGNHFPYWSTWGESEIPIPRSYWLHNLEHGGIALLYRCDEGCPEWITELREVMEAVPVDSACAPPLIHRVLLSEDPLLPEDAMVAALSWGASYTAHCVDQDSFLAFIENNYGKGPEDFCGEGQYDAENEEILDPSAGHLSGN